jgi:deoxycytidylate deaminase
MRILEGEEKAVAEKWFEICVQAAKTSTCKRHRCGALIRKNEISYYEEIERSRYNRVLQDVEDHLLSFGFNSPPGNLESQRRCLKRKDRLHPKVTDKTCCVHAEQRAIMDALRINAEALKGSRMYFARINNEGSIVASGKPYCTICSKMALDVGIKEWVLWHPEGIKEYGAEEYNELSYQFNDTGQ